MTRIESRARHRTRPAVHRPRMGDPGFCRSAAALPPLRDRQRSIASVGWFGGWSHAKRDYKVANVVSDTDALLTPSTPVLVRMETLRRASLYASTDAVTAKRLLDHLLARVDASEANGRADALALLDAAYVAEAFREIASMSSSPEFADRAPGVRAAIGKTDGTR